MSLNKKRELSEIAKIICRELRKNSTEVETILWKVLRNRNLDGKKFLRQHPFYYDINGRESFFVADFYCHQEKLVIELDGEYHKYKLTEDNLRTEIINNLGIKVIRFTNKEVINNINGIINEIKNNFQ